MCLFSALAHATDRIVPFAYQTIQAAILASSPGDRVLLQNQVFHERINMMGKNIILSSFDNKFPGTIDGSDGGSVITFTGGEPTTCKVQNITIQNGTASNGGGINGNFTLATIRNCIIRNNVATAQGGGIYGISGLVEGCTITGNQAANGGGVAGVEGTLLSNTISLNTSTGAGGGIYDCSGTIEDNDILNNTSNTDGGGLSDCTTGSLQFNTISGNTALNHGGGVYNSKIAIVGNNILNNTVTAPGSQANPQAFGGGISKCDTTILSNYIAGNTSQGVGGGIDTCDAYIANNIIYANGARNGGGLNHCTGAILNNTIYLNNGTFGQGGMKNCDSPVNCILWANTAAIDAQLDSTNPPIYCDVQNWTGGGTGNITDNPALKDPAKGDFHLLVSSPCIDAGKLTSVSTDFEGEPRGTQGTKILRGDGSKYDIGADEYLPPYINLAATWLTQTTNYKGTGIKLKTKMNGQLQVDVTGNVPMPTSAVVRFMLSNDTVVDNSDTTVGKVITLKPMAPGTSKIVKFKGKLPTGQAATGKYILGQVDAYDAILETTESDNTAVSGPQPAP